MKYTSVLITILILIVLAIFIVVPLSVDLGGSMMNLLIVLFVYIMLSQSWNLMGGYTGLINLGLAAFFGFGVLITYLLWQIKVPITLAITAGGLATAGLAIIMGVPTLRLRGMYFAIGTLALAEALSIILGNVFPSSMRMPGSYALTFNVFTRYFTGLGLALFSIAVVYFVTRSRLGLAISCVRDDEKAAQVTGINTFQYKLIALLISAFLAGLAGGVYAYNNLYFHSITDVFNPLWTFQPLMAVVIGGSGTIIGPIVGSIFLVVLSQLFSLTLGNANLIVFGLIFILVVLFLPGGLIAWLSRLLRYINNLRKPVEVRR